MTEVPVLSAVELIRQRPDMFFEGGRATMSELISLVLRDLASHDRFRAKIYRDGPYAMVGADCDWLITGRARFEELFDRFVLPSELRPNSHRSEVLLMAVCEGVLAVGANGNFAARLDLDEVPTTMAEIAKGSVRALIWKFSEG